MIGFHQTLRQRRPLAAVLALVAIGGLVAACGNGSDQPSRDSAAAEADNSAYINFASGVTSALHAVNVADMVDKSAWVVSGQVVAVESGRTVESELGTLYFADVYVSVDDELSGSSVDPDALSDGTVRVEFVVGHSADQVDSLAEALPDGRAVWFLQNDAGLLELMGDEAQVRGDREVPRGFYFLTDLEAGVAVENADSTVGFPLNPAPEPAVDLPDEVEHPHEDPVEFPTNVDSELPYTEFLEQVTAA